MSRKRARTEAKFADSPYHGVPVNISRKKARTKVKFVDSPWHGVPVYPPGSFVKAAREGKIRVMQRIYDAFGESVRNDVCRGQTALTIRHIFMDTEKIVKWLVGVVGFDPNVADEKGETAFEDAIYNGQESSFCYLLDRMQIERIPDGGYMALYGAIYFAMFDKAHGLLQRGAALHSDVCKETILHACVRLAPPRESFELLECLLRLGAVQEADKNTGLSPLMVAKRYAREGFVRLLQEYKNYTRLDILAARMCPRGCAGLDGIPRDVAFMIRRHSRVR